MKQQTLHLQQPVYIAPANPAGKALAHQLAQAGYQVAGLADNLKQADDIINNATQAKPGAVVVIADGSFRHLVAAGLQQRGFSLSQLWIANANNQLTPYRRPLAVTLRQSLLRITKHLFSALRYILPKQGYLYYAEDFFDTNVLLAYREHRRQYPAEAWLLGLKLKQTIPELETDSHVLTGHRLRTVWHCLTARKIIVDHQYTGDTFSLLRHFIPVIQLWHGLPYKALTGNIHYPHICDDAFISSSAWFNQHIFPNIFRARHYLPFGYPRNDAFLQTAAQRDWVNAEPLTKLRELQENDAGIIVYAPTFRDWGDNNYPLELPALDKWCSEHNIRFVLKFHPFISRQFSDAMGLDNLHDLQQLPGLPHIYLYPSGKNIYPWLAEARVLITDYSSIAYDFLLADKPIIYFQYDVKKYRELRGETLVADEDFIVGRTAYTQAELQHELTEQLTGGESFSLRQKRQALTEKFGLNNTLAAPEIISYIRR